MDTLLALVIGALYAAGLYLMMRRSIVRLIFGLVILGHAANLLIFTAGRIARSKPPIVPEGADVLVAPYADPLPQALILTAIVIGFGLQAFALVLFRQAHRTCVAENLDEMRTTDAD
jgi:multicomponent Na+:H+ antiporter subunit C